MLLGITVQYTGSVLDLFSILTIFLLLKVLCNNNALYISLLHQEEMNTGS
jgi:hypothetical protein